MLDPCGNNSICSQIQTDDYICSCLNDYSGANCETYSSNNVVSSNNGASILNRFNGVQIGLIISFSIFIF